MVQPPITLPGSPAMVAPAGAVARTFRLGGGMMGMSAFTINGASFDSARVDVRIPAGTTEVWEFVNATMMAHPMHVHGVLMSILDVNGAPPPDHERGLRDTVIVGAMQTVRLAVRTADTASSTPLMYHCHILEHEDAGMMGQFITY
jgi:blue copper oxidase